MKTEAKTIGSLELNKWTTSRGEIRWYCNTWKSLIGLKVQYHKSGSVSDVMIGDMSCSNRSYLRYIADCKVWIGEDSEIHIDHCGYDVIEDLIRNAVVKAMEVCR